MHNKPNFAFHEGRIKYLAKNFVNLSDKEKKRVLSCRNHPDVKKWMFHNESISEAEHLLFIEELKATEKEDYWFVSMTAPIGMILGTTYIGVIYLDSQGGEGTYLGIYTNMFDATPHKGDILMRILKKIAFKKMGLDCLNLEVYTENHVAVEFFKKHGFKPIKLTCKEDDTNIITMRLNHGS